MASGKNDTAATVAIFSAAIAILSALLLIIKIGTMFIDWETTNRDLRGVLVVATITIIFSVICKIALSKDEDLT